MTNGVKQAQAQPLTAGPGAARQSPHKGVADQGFSDALRVARTVKQDTAGKPDADAAPRWVRFSTKLDAAIDRTGNIVEKPAFAFTVPVRSDEQDSPDADDLADFEGTSDQDQAGTSDTPTPPPIPGLPFPPLHVRRIVGKEEGQSRSGHEPAGNDTADPIASPDVDIDDGESGNRVSGAGRSLDTGPSRVAASPAAVTADADAAPGIVDRPAAPADGKTDIPVDAPEPKHPDTSKIVARATILSEQSFPAPMPATAVALVEAIASDGAFLAATDRSVLQALQIQNAAASAHSLKIQLHPAELGIVTANLRFVGEQLSIELQVENSEAYQRLSTDSEAIVKSLRGLGYEIDRVTIIQPSIAVNAPVRPDANASIPGQAPRGGEPFGSGTTGGGSGGSGGQRPGGEGNDARDNGQKIAAGQRDRAGSGLYI